MKDLQRDQDAINAAITRMEAKIGRLQQACGAGGGGGGDAGAGAVAALGNNRRKRKDKRALEGNGADE